MNITSASTYARAFSTNANMLTATRNYPYKTSTMIAMSIAGILTLGIACGIAILIEKHANIGQKKIDEFCKNAPLIYEKLSDAVSMGENEVKIQLAANQEITFKQHDDPETMKSVVIISDRNHHEKITSSLEEICLKLEYDFKNAQGYFPIVPTPRSVTDKQTIANTLEAQQDSVPKFTDFAKGSSSKQEAIDKHLAAANTKFNQGCLDVAPARNKRVHFQTE